MIKDVIKGWKWIFYIFGWFFGATNIIFWLFQYGMYLGTENGDYFFSNNFHKRVFYWGIGISIFFVLGTIYLSIYLSYFII